MNNILRLVVTAIVWVMVTALGSISIIIPGEMTSGAVYITLLGLIFAYATTRSLWRVEQPQQDRLKKSRELGAEKRKRSTGDTKADMLLALMDDDEREAFKQALQARLLQGATRLRDDGELDDIEVPLEDLLREDTDYR